jgi:hypothetical protein
MVDVTIRSSLLGEANLLPSSGRMVARQGGRVVLDQAFKFRTEWVGSPDGITFWGDNPWFLDALPASQEQLLSMMGFPVDRRKRASGPLARLLTLERCKELATDDWGRFLVSALYQKFIPFIVPLLELGDDLFAAQPWDDEHLLLRLLSHNEHRSAASELAVVAALKRANLSIEREPTGRDGSRPDFVIYRDFQRIFVEVKASHSSAADKEAEELEEVLRSFTGDLLTSDKTSRIVGRPIIGELLSDPSRHEDLRQRFDRLYEDLGRCVDNVHSSGFKAGSYSGIEYFDVFVADAEEGGSVELEIWQGLDPLKDVYRLKRLVRDAAKQVPTHARCIVVLDVGGFKRIDLLRSELHRAAMEDVGRMHTVVAVVVYAYQRDPQRGNTRIAIPLWLPGRTPTWAEREVCEQLCRVHRAVL